MSTPKQESPLPIGLLQFAQNTTGDYESRYFATVNHAFYEHGCILNPHQLRALCGGGTHATAKRALHDFLAGLHRAFVERCSVEALEEWLEKGMSPDVTRLSPKERQIAKLFQNYVARLTLSH